MTHEEWLAYIVEHVTAHFETGRLYWRKPWKGRKLYKPIGCLDGNGYIKVQIAGRSTYAHSVIYFLWHGVWPCMIDHDDQDRSNNIPDNLIETDHKRNGLNSKVWETNTSGVKGASITPYGNYKVTKCGKYIGTFKTAQEAEDAYNQHR